ncbi:MAG: prepilin-type N-terminal cleavage/methylation domain-containing protein [Terrimicrobiaceae bacterium]|nr:prepilin-type N-terminal cleavage/methylation domain-containing protein [Terrimicrobiaceae bacterium]
MKTPIHIKSGSGFSLVELLVVIAVIAIIAAIAIPNIANITGAAGDSANRRNAQNIASVASAAVAAGYSGHNSTTAWIAALTNGITVTNAFGQTNGVFRLDGLSTAAISGVETYLVATNNNLTYKP